MDSFHGHSVIEKMMPELLRFRPQDFRVKRKVSFIISNNGGRTAEIIHGCHQSPILVQGKPLRNFTPVILTNTLL
jgi:hypothetical protein